jgi:hypothetical protein
MKIQCSIIKKNILFCLLCCSCSSSTIQQNEDTAINIQSEEEYKNNTTTVELSQLINCKWEYKVAEDCISYLVFKIDSTYDEYNCEWGLPYSGVYTIKEDTIFLIEMDLATNLPGENRIVNTARYKYIFKEYRLQYICGEIIKYEKCEYVAFPSHAVFYLKKTE